MKQDEGRAVGAYQPSARAASRSSSCRLTLVSWKQTMSAGIERGRQGTRGAWSSRSRRRRRKRGGAQLRCRHAPQGNPPACRLSSSADSPPLVLLTAVRNPVCPMFQLRMRTRCRCAVMARGRLRPHDHRMSAGSPYKHALKTETGIADRKLHATGNGMHRTHRTNGLPCFNQAVTHIRFHSSFIYVNGSAMRCIDP